MRIGFFLVTLCLTSRLFAQVESHELDVDWKFRQRGDMQWMPATVPGTVHTDLLANKRIPDPFLGTHEKELGWIDAADWEYQTTFRYRPDNGVQSISLIFEGLDTYARVFLNGKLILAADNMFRTWEVHVDTLLKSGENTLRIAFQSAFTRGKTEAATLPYTLPGDEKVFTRKAAYHYGWDWGPRFVTCGIWKPVKLLVQTGPLRVSHHQVSNKTITSDTATLNLRTTLSAKTNARVSVYNNATNQLLGSSAIKRDSLFTTTIKIANPKLWWCNGYGEPNLYSLRIETLGMPTGELVIDTLTVGIRTLELVQESDKAGKSFYFKLNGKLVFAKGANMIPPDNFLPRVTGAKYRQLVRQAKDANMNMLRVWGGGVYPEDAFYRACDELGIMVWQDFMFACAMYPGSDAFIENVKQEAEQQVVRLRNHASLALWCGNNEVSEGWHNWGWQKQYQYSATDSSRIWNDYLRLFENTLPGVVAQYDEQRQYWPSSPQYGWGRAQSLREGDSHYWGVWWGKQPFDVFNQKVGRFMSEYGFQGMPSAFLYTQIMEGQPASLQSAVVRHHQKHPVGFETIHEYLFRSYRVPSSFENYRYISQLVQGEGMRIAIEAHRRNQPYCMGSLYWQLNDCWPVTSWSSLDNYEIPKAAHFFIARSFRAAGISVVKDKTTYTLHVFADHAGEGTLETTLYDFAGNRLRREQKKISMGAISSQPVFTFDSTVLLAGNNGRDRVLYSELKSVSSEVLATHTFYFTEIKDLLLQNPGITWTVDSKKQTLRIKATSLAKNVYLDAGEQTRFSDNYFDLLPGQSVQVNFTTPLPPEEFIKRLACKSVYDTLQP